MAKVLDKITTKLVNLDLVEIKDEKNLPIPINKMVGNLISQAKSNDPIRALLIAQQIYQAQPDKPITLEDADYDMVLQLINEADWSNLIKGKVLEAFTSLSK